MVDGFCVIIRRMMNAMRRMKTVLFLYAHDKPSVNGKMAGVYAYAQSRDWSVQTIESRLTPKKTRDLLAFWNPAGAIVECGGGANQIAPNLFGNVPVVFLDRNPKTLRTPAFCVKHDSTATTHLATRELLSSGPLASYAYVPWPKPRFWSDERVAAFDAALRLNGHRCVRFTESVDEKGLTTLHARLGAWLAALPKPVGVFAANDFMAAQTLAAAARFGIAVPDEAVVVGVDNNELLCENTHPSLSSVMPDFRTAGYRAAEMLDALIAAPNQRPYTTTFGPLRLVRRASSNRTVRGDPFVQQALDQIRRDACNGLAARDVLAHFPCSRRMAEIRFRRLTGHSVLDEIQSVRRAKAMELLQDPTLSRTAVANFCGYSSANALMTFLRRDAADHPS